MMKLVAQGSTLDLSHPHVMGILNVTPDSFSDGGAHNSLVEAVKHANLMINAGATIIDIGGESTRPGAAEVSVEEELARVIPVVEAIAQRFEVWISVDTSKPEVIRESARAGAHIINDIRSLTEPGALQAAAETGLPVCLMHMQGQPKTMQEAPKYEDVFADVERFFAEHIVRCEQAGIAKEKLLLDPGFGFVMSNRKYFGTDGIRGRVGDAPITPEFVLKLGWAAGKVLARHGSRKIIIGKDTRISGYMLESALEAGLAAAGLSASFTGPMPTPAIAYLTRAFRAEAGIVISASHNPFYDNGIKFFSIEGTKLPDDVEEAIEAEMEKELTCVDSAELGKASRIVDAAGRYIEFCKGTFPNELSLGTLKVVVDCAHGATYHIAPNVFRELGAQVIAMGCEPDGLNINEEVGATDVRALQARVLAEKADLGIAYDGDGDRVIMVDHEGNKVDGDQILYIIAREGLRQGQLRGGAVGTLMSNMGLELALKQLGIPFARAKVGDRYVLEMLQEKGWRIGAENSGHVILLDKTTTGDGIVASLQVVAAMVRNHMSLHDLCSGMKMFPQLLVNVRFTEGSGNPLENEHVKAVTAEVEAALGKRGRVLLRKSGTEPLIRVMVEGEHEDQVHEFAHRIAEAVKSV